jgi:hypothetical protein
MHLHVLSCQCIQLDTTLQDQIHRLQSNSNIIIFEGLVVKHVRDSNNINHHLDYPAYYYWIKPIKAWTPLGETDFIQIYDDGTSCSFRLMVDSTYLLFGRNVGPMGVPLYLVHICDPNKSQSTAEQAIQILGAPSGDNFNLKYSDNSPTVSTKKSFETKSIMLIISLLANLVLIILFRRKR